MSLAHIASKIDILINLLEETGLSLTDQDLFSEVYTRVIEISNFVTDGKFPSKDDMVWMNTIYTHANKIKVELEYPPF